MKRSSATSIVLVMLLLAACAGGEAEEGSGLATLETTGDTAATTEVATAEAGDAEAALLGFARCMRENGFPEFPDPTLNPDGSIGFGAVLDRLEDAGIDPQADEFRSSLNICVERFEGVALALIGEAFDVTELQDTLLAFAQCMREQGIQVDDPDLSDFSGPLGEGRGPFGNIDFDDPDVQAALEICRQEVIFPGLDGSSPSDGAGE